MPSILSTAARNRASDDNATGYPYYSLHTGDPGTTGANEATGGTPAYARKQPAMGAASGGTATSTGAVNFDVPAGTYSWLGRWSAATGGTFGGAVPIGPIVLPTQDVIVLQTATVSTPASPTSTSGIIYHYRPGIALPSGSTFTRATVANQYNKDGNWAQLAAGVMRDGHYIGHDRVLLLEEARTNSVLHARDFTQAAWANSAVAAKDAIGIDNVANAASTVSDSDTAANLTALQNITIPNDSATHRISHFVQKDFTTTRFPWFEVRMDQGTTATNVAIAVNTKTGETYANSILGGIVGAYSVRVEDWGKYWRVIVSVTNNSTGNTRLRLLDWPAIVSTLSGSPATTTTGSIIVDGAQVELAAAFATSPIYTTSASVTRNADALSIAGFSTGTATLYQRYYDISSPGSAVTDAASAYTSTAAIVPAVNRGYTDIAILDGTLTAAQCRDILAIAA